MSIQISSYRKKTPTKTEGANQFKQQNYSSEPYSDMVHSPLFRWKTEHRARIDRKLQTTTATSRESDTGRRNKKTRANEMLNWCQTWIETTTKVFKDQTGPTCRQNKAASVNDELRIRKLKHKTTTRRWPECYQWTLSCTSGFQCAMSEDQQRQTRRRR